LRVLSLEGSEKREDQEKSCHESLGFFNKTT